MAPKSADTQPQQPQEYPSLVELRNALPADVFRASAATSLYYVARSAVLIAAAAAAVHWATAEGGVCGAHVPLLHWTAWAAYWAVQGTLMWGVFVLGHDCGHASFSRSPLLNQVFGNLLHSVILVPYESWKITHRIHHKNTGNIDNDEIFYPHRVNSLDNRIKRIVVATVGFAWPMYLYGSRHFNVNEPILKSARKAVIVSLVCWSIAAALVVLAGQEFGWTAVGLYYLAPLLVFMSWLVLTTFLHHQDPDAPWFAYSNWTYVKGNLSSIDRSYGPVVDNLIHNIGTHQIHHLFPKIPHYKLLEATAHFRPAYPQLVRTSDEHNIIAFFRNWWIYMRYAVAPEGVDYFSYREAMKGAYVAHDTAKAKAN